MKVKVETIDFPIAQKYALDNERHVCRYICRYKFHWWQSWRYINYPHSQAPELFGSLEEIEKRLDELGFKTKQ